MTVRLEAHSNNTGVFMNNEQLDAPTKASFTIDQIIDRYLGIREQIDAINADAKSKVEPLEKAKKILESHLMKVSNDTGQTQFGTANGTAFLTTVTRCGVSDWEATMRYIRENEAWNLLNKAVNKTAIGELIQQTGLPPPGVNWQSMKEIQIRRKSTGKQKVEAE